MLIHVSVVLAHRLAFAYPRELFATPVSLGFRSQALPAVMATPFIAAVPLQNDPPAGKSRPIPAQGSYWRHNIGRHPLYLHPPSQNEPVILHYGHGVAADDVVIGPVHNQDETSRFVAVQVPWPRAYCTEGGGDVPAPLVWVNIWCSHAKNWKPKSIEFMIAVPWREVETWKVRGWRDMWLFDPCHGERLMKAELDGVKLSAMLSNMDFQATLTKDAVIEYMTGPGFGARLTHPKRIPNVLF